MKKIDRLLIRSFIPPFIVTFFIAMFVLIMQFLWTYIDVIVSKGTGVSFVLEIIFYLSMSLIPIALPIALLISSVMIMGNMAERYELSSLKSAGISLLRIIRPLLFFACGVGIFSFFCSNNLIPIANLQFKSRLHDLYVKKPNLNLEENVFNDDFAGYVMHIGEKEKNNNTIVDILIYDHTDEKNQSNILTAEKGEMFTTDNDQYFVMKLLNGTQYQEVLSSDFGKEKTYPYIRTSFKEWTKIFNLNEFKLNPKDLSRFKHETMMNSSQLITAIDFIDANILKQQNVFKNRLDQHFYFSKQKREHFNHKKLKQHISNDLSKHKSMLDFFPANKKRNLHAKAKTYARKIHGQAGASLRVIDKQKEKRIKHVYELHSKFSLAFVCLIFLFIGAPMGTIIKKGGFGWPLIISILFFILFILMNTFSKKLAGGNILSPNFAAWLPCFILMIIGAVLSYRAMNDLRISNFIFFK